MAREPVEVQVAVGADLEEVAGQPGNGDVTADTTVLVQQEGVRDGADGLVDLAGGQALQEAAAAPGPPTSRRLRAVMSYIATVSRVACASAPTIGDQ